MQRIGYMIQSATSHRIIISWLPDRQSALDMANRLARGIGCNMLVWHMTAKTCWLIYVAQVKS